MWARCWENYIKYLVFWQKYIKHLVFWENYIKLHKQINKYYPWIACKRCELESVIQSVIHILYFHYYSLFTFKILVWERETERRKMVNVRWEKGYLNTHLNFLHSPSWWRQHCTLWWWRPAGEKAQRGQSMAKHFWRIHCKILTKCHTARCQHCSRTIKEKIKMPCTITMKILYEYRIAQM